MKYLKFISENTIKNLIEKKLNLKVEKVIKTNKKCLVIINSNGYDLDLKFEINDFEAICLNNFKTNTTKQITKLFRDLFEKFFKDLYLQDLNDYLNIKQNKFIKNLRNYQIENIFKGFKVLQIKRKQNAIEVIATNNINKEFLICYKKNFKIINKKTKQYIKEIKKIEKNYITFKVSTYGQAYIEALILNENKPTEDIKKC